MNNPVGIAVGGSALSPRHRVPASPRLMGEEIQVASLYLLPGLLAQLSNSALADSNGEHLYFYHSDHLGTPLFLTDTDGVVVWRGEYLPFGEVFSEHKDPDGDGVEVEQPFRFPGQYEDTETGLYYNYFRDYDSSLGRYIEADPIGLAGGVNLYLYVIGNPIDLADPFGMFGTTDFVYHYYQGFGSIDLGDVGLLNAFKSSPSVTDATSTFIQKIKSEATDRAKSLCCGKNGRYQTDTFSCNDTTITDVTNVRGLYAVGHSTFFRNAFCTLASDCYLRKYSYVCSFSFSIRDWYRRPLGEGMPEPGGIPYQINAAWNQVVSGGGSF